MEGNLILDADLVKREYAERLKEAELSRRYKHLKTGEVQARFWSSVGDYLISIGEKLKSHQKPVHTVRV